MSKNHPHDNIYSILGKLAALTPKEEPTAETPKMIYESVESQGSILKGLRNISTIESRLAEAFAKDKDGEHCKECDCLLQLFLGKNCHEFIAAMQKEAVLEPKTSTPTIEELSQEEGDGVKMTVPEESQVFKVVHKEEAIQDKTYPNYRLSEDMQQESASINSSASAQASTSGLTMPR